MNEFCGFTPETYTFLMELAFSNNKAFFSANRETVCQRGPANPCGSWRKCSFLPCSPSIRNLIPECPALSLGYTGIRAIARTSLLTAANLWLAYRRPGQRLSESLCMYFEMSPEGYGYGLGMYHTNTALMQKLRQHATADPAGFEALVNVPCMQRYAPSGELYQRDRFALPESS